MNETKKQIPLGDDDIFDRFVSRFWQAINPRQTNVSSLWTAKTIMVPANQSILICSDNQARKSTTVDYYTPSGIIDVIFFGPSNQPVSSYIGGQSMFCPTPYSCDALTSKPCYHVEFTTAGNIYCSNRSASSVVLSVREEFYRIELDND